MRMWFFLLQSCKFPIEFQPFDWLFWKRTQDDKNDNFSFYHHLIANKVKSWKFSTIPQQFYTKLLQIFTRKNAMEICWKNRNYLQEKKKRSYYHKNLIGSLFTEVSWVQMDQFFSSREKINAFFSSTFAIVFALNNNWFPYRIGNKWNFYFTFTVFIAP